MTKRIAPPSARITAIASCIALLAATASAEAAAPRAKRSMASSRLIIQAESMDWPLSAGRIYFNKTRRAGFLADSGLAGRAVVRTTRRLTGVDVRVRSAQSGRLCRHTPRISLRIDGVERLAAEVPAGGEYELPVADLDTPPGTHTLEIAPANDDPPTCRSGLFVDRTTLVASQPFSADGWRNGALADNAPLADDQTAALGLRSQVQSFGTWVSTTAWSSPLYVVPANQPRVPIAVDTRYAHYNPVDMTFLRAELASVPLPADATPSGPPQTGSVSWSDKEIVVYQPATDTAWELYHAVRWDNRWTVTDGGKISDVSTKDGYDRWATGKPHGMTGSGIPLLAGLQTLAELQSGSIDHAVVASIPHVRKGVLRRPATRTDGEWTTWDAVPEGARFRLPADLDVNSLPLTPYAKIVARAIQRHGLVVIDRNCRPSDTAKCSSVTFKAEDPRPVPDSTHPDPYAPIFGGVDRHHLFDNFPWDRLQLLQEG